MVYFYFRLSPSTRASRSSKRMEYETSINDGEEDEILCSWESIKSLMHTPRICAAEWTDAPDEFNDFSRISVMGKQASGRIENIRHKINHALKKWLLIWIFIY